MFAAALISAVPLPRGQRARTSAPAPASDSVSNNSVADNTTLPSAPFGTCPPEPFVADITASQPECLACCGPLQETSASSACAPCVPFACCSPLPCPASFKEFDQLVAGAPSYDRHVRPPPHDTPTVVALPLVPQQIGVLDTRQQRVTVELQVSFAWQDTRLRFDPSCLVERGAYTFLDRTVIWPPMLPLYVIQAESSGVWVPPVIVDNAHPNAEEFRARDEQFFIYSTGAVWYSYRASFDVKCGMDFSEMPWDTQECYVRLVAADEHSRMTLALGDIAGGDAAYYERNVYNTPQMHHLMSSTEWECTEIRGRNGTGLAGRLFASSKDYVELVFTFERRSAWYANNVVRPTILLVAISWLSFFISRTAVPARVAMTLICYLTLSNLNSMVSASLPKLSYYVRLLGLMTASQGWCTTSHTPFLAPSLLTRSLPQRFCLLCDSGVCRRQLANAAGEAHRRRRGEGTRRGSSCWRRHGGLRHKARANAATPSPQQLPGTFMPAASEPAAVARGDQRADALARPTPRCGFEVAVPYRIRSRARCVLRELGPSWLHQRASRVRVQGTVTESEMALVDGK